MQHYNFSKVTEILLLGFHNFNYLNFLFFPLFLIIFCVTLCGNLLIILVVAYSQLLHSPMYFLLTQLSFTDILLSLTIVPNMLHIMLNEGSLTPLIGCLVQFHFFAGSIGLECLLLTVMSYDRYQAICNPLHYTSTMTLTFCLRIILLFWLMVLSLVVLYFFMMSHLNFCGPYVINHFFCDLEPLLELSCSDTFMIKMEILSTAILFSIFPLIVVIISYVYIIFTILKIPSVTGRQKTFSTCSAHLSVVSMYYGSIIIIYVLPHQQNANALLSLFYTVVTPLLNPMVYSLSNRDIKQALFKLLTNFSYYFVN